LQTQSTLSQSQRIHKSNPYSAAELTLAAARLDQQEQGLPDTPPTSPDVPTVDSTDVEDKSENISFFNASGDPIVLDHAGDPTSDAMVLTPKEHGLTFVQDCLALVANRTRHWKQQQVIRRAFAAIKQEDSDLIKYALEEKRLTDNRDDSYDQLMEDRKQCMNRLNVWRADQIQQERDAYSAKEQELNTTMVKVRRDADYLALDERSGEDDSAAAAAAATGSSGGTGGSTGGSTAGNEATGATGGATEGATTDATGSATGGTHDKTGTATGTTDGTVARPPPPTGFALKAEQNHVLGEFLHVQSAKHEITAMKEHTASDLTQAISRKKQEVLTFHLSTVEEEHKQNELLPCDGRYDKVVAKMYSALVKQEDAVSEAYVRFKTAIQTVDHANDKRWGQIARYGMAIDKINTVREIGICYMLVVLVV
jgi:hypothetical protein